MLEKSVKKPRLVFFQWKHNMLPKFLQSHMQLHIKCLSEFFDLVVINTDCDYDRVCDKYQPDLTLFESGFRSTLSKKIEVKNTYAHPAIPKLGLHNGDAWCDCRVGFISDMEKWGIETYFSISTTMAEHTPELSDNLFIWPNFIDSDIFRDYEMPKIVPITLNGNLNSLYPWRLKIFNKINNHYTSLVFPHLGYESHSPFMIYGEQYARTINASYFMPACGTVAKEVVRKHFEIPGSKSCLITEYTPMLESAGFSDMKNCVFADEGNVLEKLNFLFTNISELEKITNAGYKLVHSHHTYKQRDQILQWYNLHKVLKHNEKIVQENPFERLVIIKKSKCSKVNILKCGGLHLEMMRKGDEKLWSCKYDEAESFYLECLKYIPWMSEPKLKLALCSLYRGDAGKAIYWIKQPIKFNFTSYGALDPDPIEWAYLIISLLCHGKIVEATIRANQFPYLHHLELDRIRLIIRVLCDKNKVINVGKDIFHEQRRSIYEIPKTSLHDWLHNLSVIFKACAKNEYIAVLNRINNLNDENVNPSKRKNHLSQKVVRNYLLEKYIRIINNINKLFDKLNIPYSNRGLPSIFIDDYLLRLAKWAKAGVAVRLLLKKSICFYNRLNTVAISLYRS